MKTYKRYRYPSQIISHAVWLYHRFSLSFRDIEDILAARGVIVSYETIRHRQASGTCQSLLESRGQCVLRMEQVGCLRPDDRFV